MKIFIGALILAFICIALNIKTNAQEDNSKKIISIVNLYENVLNSNNVDCIQNLFTDDGLYYFRVLQPIVELKH